MFDHDQNKLLKEILEVLREILERLPKPQPKAKSATLSLGGKTMPLTVHVNDTPGTALFQEFSGANGTGIVVPPVGAVTYASDTPAVATVDPASGQLAYVGPGTATISGTDAGNGLAASDVLTVSAASAVSATLTLTAGA